MTGSSRQTGEFVVDAIGAYDFAASVKFWEGFTPAAYDSSDKLELRLAFASEEDFSTGAAYVTSNNAEGTSVRIETYGDSGPETVRDQTVRVLSLDFDGDQFKQIVIGDPVLHELWNRYEGLRPVLFYSPYEAASWAVIANRIRIAQAAAIKKRMADELGATIEIRGQTVHAFPSPMQVLGMTSFQGISERKVEYLHAVASAALDGRLDSSALRAMSPDDALEQLQSIKGIGPFGAELTLIRGVGLPDRMAMVESRLAPAIALAYDLDHEPDAESIFAMAEAWRPFRSWVTLLLRRSFEDEMH